MNELKSIAGQNFVDVVLAASGAINNLFEVAITNEVSIDILPDPGTVFYYDDPMLQIGNPITKVLPFTAARQKVVGIASQNLQDLTIQTKGSIELLFDFAIENNESITNGVLVGRNYFVPGVEGEVEIVNYFKAREIKIATGNNNVTDVCIYAECGYVEKGYWE